MILATNSGVIGATTRHYPLGPDLGQCCGGSVEIEMSIFNQSMRTMVQAKRDGYCRYRQY